jgi:hypothetical protein
VISDLFYLPTLSILFKGNRLIFKVKMSLNIRSKITRFILLSIPLLVVIAGCGKAQLEELQSELANERSANEKLEEQKAEAQSAETAHLSKIQELESSLAKMQEREKGMYAQYLSKLSAKNKEVKKYKSAYLALKSQDQTEFSRLSKLMNEKKWDEASEGFKSFINAYPKSDFIEDARNEYARSLNESRQEAAARLREEPAQREESLKAQIEKGELSPDQLKPYLMGKTPQQVRDFLGEPTSTYTGNKWRYTDKVLNPYSGVKNSLKIQFKNGVVTLVDYWGGY